jgi:hypothetical protein
MSSSDSRLYPVSAWPGGPKGTGGKTGLCSGHFFQQHAANVQQQQIRMCSVVQAK